MSPAPWQSLQLQRTGTVARLVMQRPQVHNAFDARLIAELTDALVALDGDTSVRAVVLTGAGSTFSAGADLNWMRDMARASEQENAAHNTLLGDIDKSSKGRTVWRQHDTA